jgi:tetratricopeptide (TPR) repeat protein
MLRGRADKASLAGHLPLSSVLLKAARGLLDHNGSCESDSGMWIYNSDGVLAFMEGDYVGAEECFRKALLVSSTLFGVYSVEVAAAKNNLAQALSEQARYDEAEQLFTCAIAMMEDLRGPLVGDAKEEKKLKFVDNGLADARAAFEKMKTLKGARSS